MRPRESLPGPAARAWALLVNLLAVAAGACTPEPAPISASNPAPAIAEVHARKCGVCHRLPEAKTRSRPYLEEELSHHRRRVKLSEDEWRAMVDYLASPG